MAKNKFSFASVLKFFKRLMIFFFVSTLFIVLFYRFVNPPATPLMLVRSCGQLLTDEKLEMKKNWLPLESI